MKYLIEMTEADVLNAISMMITAISRTTDEKENSKWCHDLTCVKVLEIKQEVEMGVLERFREQYLRQKYSQL